MIQCLSEIDRDSVSRIIKISNKSNFVFFMVCRMSRRADGRPNTVTPKYL